MFDKLNRAVFDRGRLLSSEKSEPWFFFDNSACNYYFIVIFLIVEMKAGAIMQKDSRMVVMGGELALRRIFEAGVFYNAAVMLYRDDIKLIDDFTNDYDNCPPEISDGIGCLLFLYLIEREPQQELLFFQAMYHFTSGANIVFAARDLKAKLVLPWQPFYLSKKERVNLRPDILLEEFLTLVSTKKGFRSVTEDDVNRVAGKFSLLTHFREENHFFQHRIKLKRNSENRHIHIFYKRDRVSFRKSLVNALENIKHQYGCDILADKWSSKNMSSLGEMLLAQAYLYTKDSHGLSQEAYFGYIIKRYPAMEYIGLRDKKNLYEGKRKLDALTSVFTQNYEMDEDELAIQRQNFEHRNRSAMDTRISPSILLKSALSIYINYYTFALSHVDFMRQLYQLRESINDIVTRQFKQNEFVAFDILNRVNRSLGESSKAPGADIIVAVETQCHGALTALRAYPIKQDYWGHFAYQYIIPKIDKVVQSMGALYTLCNENYQHVTYEHFKMLDWEGELSKALIINHFIAVNADVICAGYGLSDHTMVIPMNAPDRVYGSISAALDLYDKNAKKNYLSSTIIHEDIQKLQCILWGLYHLYHKSFSCEKITNELSIDKIGQFYQQPISESKFKTGKKAAQQLIASYPKTKWP